MFKLLLFFALCMQALGITAMKDWEFWRFASIFSLSSYVSFAVGIAAALAITKHLPSRNDASASASASASAAATAALFIAVMCSCITASLLLVRL
jgi:hypothetical protein